MIPHSNEFDTASVSDASDSLGLSSGWLQSLAARSPGTTAVGPAYTVLYRKIDSTHPGFRNAANYIDDVPAGSVIVSVNPTRMACTTWGELLSVTAITRGVAGTVVAGFARDMQSVQHLGYPLFSRGVSMVSAKNRIELDAVQVPVEVDGVIIRPGDIVVADDSGVIAIPAQRSGEVLRRAQSVEAVEREIADAVRRGQPLRDARQEYGYATPWSRSTA